MSTTEGLQAAAASPLPIRARITREWRSRFEAVYTLREPGRFSIYLGRTAEEVQENLDALNQERRANGHAPYVVDDSWPDVTPLDPQQLTDPQPDRVVAAAATAVPGAVPAASAETVEFDLGGEG